MKKNLLVMMNSMGIGGVEKAFLNLLAFLDQDQFNITVLFYKKEGELLNRIPSWVKVEELKISNLARNLLEYGSKRTILESLRRYRYVTALKIILSYLKRKVIKMFSKSNDPYHELFKYLPIYNGHFDVALDFFGHSSITTYYISEKVKADIKATWLHRSDFDNQIRTFSSYYDKYDRVYGVSNACIEKFIGIFPEYAEKCETFTNILLIENIKKEAERGTGFNHHDSGMKILTVGRLVSFKGYDIAISVAAKLKKEGFQFKWYAIGEGSEREMLETLIQQYEVADSFILLGKSDNPYPYMKQCDIYVQSSRSEGYCITLAEARMLNKPIVTTNFFGAREQIIHGKTGLIVNVDEDEIYEAVKKLMTEEQLRRSFSENLSKENISPVKEAEKLYALFNEGNKKQPKLVYEVKASV